MARPALDPALKRVSKTVSLNSVELSESQANAAAANLPWSDFARVALTKPSIQIVHSHMPEFAYRHDLRTIGAEASRIGNNLNQIAHQLNVGKGVSHAHLNHALSRLDEFFDKMDLVFDQWLRHDPQSFKSRPQL